MRPRRRRQRVRRGAHDASAGGRTALTVRSLALVHAGIKQLLDAENKATEQVQEARKSECPAPNCAVILLVSIAAGLPEDVLVHTRACAREYTGGRFAGTQTLNDRAPENREGCAHQAGA
jgi:hypothetical protein